MMGGLNGTIEEAGIPAASILRFAEALNVEHDRSYSFRIVAVPGGGDAAAGTRCRAGQNRQPRRRSLRAVAFV